MEKKGKLLEEYTGSPTRSLFLGQANKKLKQYKEESRKIGTCICGKPIGLNEYYGEVGHIGYTPELVPTKTCEVERIVIGSIEPKKTNKQGEKLPTGWWYDFVKLCPGCFHDVSRLLISKTVKGQRILKERTKHGIHQAEK